MTTTFTKLGVVIALFAITSCDGKQSYDIDTAARKPPSAPDKGSVDPSRSNVPRVEPSSTDSGLAPTQVVKSSSNTVRATSSDSPYAVQGDQSSSQGERGAVSSKSPENSARTSATSEEPTPAAAPSGNSSTADAPSLPTSGARDKAGASSANRKPKSETGSTSRDASSSSAGNGKPANAASGEAGGASSAGNQTSAEANAPGVSKTDRGSGNTANVHGRGEEGPERKGATTSDTTTNRASNPRAGTTDTATRRDSGRNKQGGSKPAAGVSDTARRQGSQGTGSQGTATVVDTTSRQARESKSPPKPQIPRIDQKRSGAPAPNGRAAGTGMKVPTRRASVPRKS